MARCGLAASLALLAFAAWASVYIVSARDEARALERHLSATEAAAMAGAPDVGTQVAETQRVADRLRVAADGPPLRILAAIPWVGEPFRVTAELTDVLDSVASDALPSAVDGARHALGRPVVVGGAVDVTAIRDAAPSLSSADAAIGSALRDARRSSGQTWAAQVNRIRSRVIDELSALDRSLSAASTAADLVPSMLGADAPRTMAIVVENDSEARATGGLPGGLVVVRFDRGRMRILRIVEDLAGPAKAPTDLGADYRGLYGFAQPTQLWQTSNLSPSFPYAARIWRSLTRQQTGIEPDIVVGIDSHALSDVLRVVGGVTLDDDRTVTADSVIPFIGLDSYQQFGDDRAGRKTVMGQVARLTLVKIMQGRFDAHELVTAIAGAANSSRITVWSSSSAEQAQLTVTPVAGELPFTPDPYVGVFVNNSYGSKLDYFLDRAIRVAYGVCSATRQQVTVTVILTNSTPQGRYAPEVLGTFLPYVPDGGRLPPRSNRLSVYLFGTWASRTTSVSLDGRPTPFGTGVENRRPVSFAVVDLAPGEPARLAFSVDMPRRDSPALIPTQPLTRPASVRVDGRPCTS
ncbi:Protein of unknown function (DUF4012) [Williamsia deligens]|nr:Protein of unknown function (DUF4012) [Williamsia deligens]